MGRVAVAMVLMFGLGRVLGAQGAAPAWKVELERRHQALVERNGPGTDAPLREQLLKMKTEDQEARGMGAGAAGSANAKGQIAGNLVEIDAALTVQLKEIVARVGWPTIAQVGIDASNGAMLVLTHTRDHAWQQELIPKLEALADAGRIDPAALAIVIDKELVSEGKLQRYGTQFTAVDGSLAMYGAEDPGGLDKLRAMVMLPPVEAYQQQLAGLFHLKVGGKIVSAAK